MGRMPLGPQTARHGMGGMSAAHPMRSATRSTIQPMIPRTRTQPRGRPHNAAVDRERNSVERFFCRLKHVRAVATRYDKRTTTEQATVLPASVVLCVSCADRP